MVEVIVGFFCLTLGIYQLYVTYKLFFEVKKNGNKDTSPFILWSFWSSIVFGVALSSLGILFVFKWI